MSECRGCTDAVLQNIARYCSNLKELNLESCRGITDNGIAALLKPHDNSEQAMVATRLAYLNVSSTLVTMKSLVALLNGLPMLLSLSFSGLRANPCTKFTKLNSDQLRLQYLDLLGTFSRFSTLKEVMKSCPDLIELKLSIPANAYENTHELFAGLRKCSKLKSITVNVVYFPKSELPRQRFELGKSFFGHIGRQLESLNLAGAMNLCLVALCHHCNALKQLVLQDCHLIQPFLPNMKILPKEPNSLCNISTLSVFCSALQAINLEQVQFNGISLSQKQELLDHLLTSHPNLHELSLKSVPIEEDILMKILLSSSGSKLRKLVLSCYDNITSKTVVWIEENCLRLEYLELLHSWVMTWSDICQINNRARRNGRNLRVVVPDEYDLIGL